VRSHTVVTAPEALEECEKVAKMGKTSSISSYSSSSIRVVVVMRSPCSARKTKTGCRKSFPSSLHLESSTSLAIVIEHMVENFKCLNGEKQVRLFDRLMMCKIALIQSKK